MTAEALSSLLPMAIDAATKACAVIMDVYDSGDFQAEAKGDHSPLTRADKNAHQVISSILEQTGLPVLSEEGRSIAYDERKGWPYFWMVDPLDGTKEFLKRNDEFTVNIALIHEHTPVIGVVAVPVSGDIYYAQKEHGARVIRRGQEMHLSKRKPVDLDQTGIRVVASRSHLDPATQAFIERLDQPVLVSKGSSLKFLLLAEGLADVYPRYAPTMEWDTAAAHIIVQEAGLRVLNVTSHEALRYNKEDLLNPFFIVQ